MTVALFKRFYYDKYQQVFINGSPVVISHELVF